MHVNITLNFVSSDSFLHITLWHICHCNMELLLEVKRTIITFSSLLICDSTATGAVLCVICYIHQYKYKYMYILCIGLLI